MPVRYQSDCHSLPRRIEIHTSRHRPGRDAVLRGTMNWSGDLGIKTTNYLGLGVSRYPGHALSPDGEWIASSDFGPRITVHRFAEPGKIVATLGGAARDYDTAVVFSRDGSRLFTGNEDGRIRVWDTATWQELPAAGWPAHRSAVTALAVSHDGSLIATSGDDTLKLFPAQPEPGESTRRERLSFRLDSPANWIHFARGQHGRDRALLHSSPRGTLEVWETDEAGNPAIPPAATGDLPFPLRSHEAIVLPDGKVLVAGVESTGGLPLSDCLLYDPAKAVWSPASPLRRPRKQAALTRLTDGTVLIAGGMGRGAVPLQSCERYDPAAGTWRATGAMTTPHEGGAFIALEDGRVLAAGGWDGGSPTAGCELYDPADGTWSATGPLTAARQAASWVLLANGRILAVGGTDAKGAPLGSCELYDPAAGAWTATGSLAVPRSGAPAVVLPGGEVLVAGGSPVGDAMPLACERYDPLTGRWMLSAPLPFPYLSPQATLLASGKVMVAGSMLDPNAISPDAPLTGTPAKPVFVYDPATDTWTPAPDLPDLPALRSRHSATLLKNGKILLTGGSDGRNRVTRKVDVYDPEP